MKKYSFNQIAGAIAAVVAGMWGYNYFSQKNYGTPRTVIGQGANKDEIKIPKIQHAPSSDKRISATEESLTTPSKNATSRSY
jgi:hypothetical protein